MSNLMSNLLTKVDQLISAANVAFIASIDADGFPNLKAMLPPRQRNGLTTFYFTTNTSSRRVTQFRKNPQASIYFYGKGRFNYQGVMLVGTMTVLTDTASKKMIWRLGDQLYYSQGVTDPDYCVLQFTAHQGRYYSNFHSEDFTIEP